MSSVWLGKDQLLGRDVAVKQVISLEGMPEADAEAVRGKALHEGRVASKLAHRHAIAVYDVILDRGTPWLVMEYMPSRNVAQILHVTEHLDPIDAAQIGAQVASAAADAHEAGVIHRDIKPGNILIANTGRDAGLVKLTDFGIAQFKDEDDDGDLISGTPAYFAPEVARGAAPSEASDVYSLGSTIYTMVEGVPPFGMSEDVGALLDSVARARIRPPEQAGPLHDVLLSMLTPSPAKRPTMAQVRDELAVIAARATRSTPEHVLTGRISRPDGAPPVWALATPTAPRMRTGAFPRSYVPAPAPSAVAPATAPRRAPAPAPATTGVAASTSNERRWLIIAGVVALIAVLVIVLAVAL
ncbi:serine/threonine-protein kinase [Gordonia sp. (in: high G+C Gram-positive bacteria)]|uniref:serine/threonine-protein kinase n=1 Tax=Gordonia sp. (in: high G+C Gram-positive bacteria) TaxID=84139 RepID=UPI0039E3AF1D